MSELGNAGNVTNSAPVIDFITQPDSPDKPARAGLPAASRAATPVKTIAATPMGFGNRVANFAQPGYAPNQTEPQTASPQNHLANLRAKNTAVINSANQLPHARLARNQTLYHDTTGLVKTDLDIKRYLKSVLGATSP